MDDKKLDQDESTIMPQAQTITPSEEPMTNAPQPFNLNSAVITNPVQESTVPDMEADVSGTMPDLANESDTPPTDAIMPSAQTTQTAPDTKAEGHSKSLAKIISVSIVVVIALSVAAYFAFIGGDTSTSTTKKDSTSEVKSSEATVDDVASDVDDTLNQVDAIEDVDSNDLSDTSLEL